VLLLNHTRENSSMIKIIIISYFSHQKWRQNNILCCQYPIKLTNNCFLVVVVVVVVIVFCLHHIYHFIFFSTMY